MRRLRADWVLVGVLLAYPFVPFLDWAGRAAFGRPLGLERELVSIFIFGILGLSLNLQVGYAGLLQLGIGAFFAIGVFTTGILTVSFYPFQLGFWGALVLSPLVAGVAGLLLGAPTLRLRGDYLAIVTLGFGEVVNRVLINLENVTGGTKSLNPVPPPWVPPALTAPFMDGGRGDRAADVIMYYVALLTLAGVVVVMRNIERSRLGRAFVALREDELVVACMGLNAGQIKLIAFSVGAAIAALAGVLFATHLRSTSDPSTYDFNTSIMVLCCVLIGGLGSIRGTLVGVAVLIGIDKVVFPLLTDLLRTRGGAGSASVLLQASNWRWIVFGTALVLMMRFRPEGIFPSSRVRAELHEEGAAP
jgi:branched-chain amino acid transport system permease protein